MTETPDQTREERKALFAHSDRVIDVYALTTGMTKLEAVDVSKKASRPGPCPWDDWIAAVLACDNRYDVSWKQVVCYLAENNIRLSVDTPTEGASLAHGKLPERWFFLVPPEAFSATSRPDTATGSDSTPVEAGTGVVDVDGTSQTFVGDMLADATAAIQLSEVDAHLEEIARRKAAGEPVSYGTVTGSLQRALSECGSCARDTPECDAQIMADECLDRMPTDSLRWHEPVDDDGEGELETAPLQYSSDLVNSCAYHAGVMVPDVVGCLDIRMANKLDVAEANRTAEVWEWWVGGVMAANSKVAVSADVTRRFYAYCKFFGYLGREGRVIRETLVKGQVPDLWEDRIATAWPLWRASLTEAAKPADTQPSWVDEVSEGPGKAAAGSDVWSSDAKANVLHQSHVSMMLRCGLQFQYRYVDQIIIPPALRMVGGTAGHKGVEIDLSHKMELGELAPVELIKDTVADEYRRRIQTDGFQLDDDEKDEGVKAAVGRHKDRAIAQTLAFHESTAPDVWPTALERRFRVRLPGRDYEIGGAIDITEAERTSDLKFTGKPPSDNAADTSLQLSTYALAGRILDGAIPDQLGLHKIVLPPKRGEAYVKSVWSTRTPADLKKAVRYYDWAHATKVSGAFHPADPESWCCSPKWCGYWDMCPFGDKGRMR